jgi:deazaflavin-dependent oxidoreductase (nitroreductase family)
MPFPRALARFNKRITNRVQAKWAHLLPGYGIVEHTGRTSGRSYRTPVNVFSAPGGFVVLFYGRDSDWVRNVRAAAGGQMLHRGQRYLLSNPQIVGGDAARRLVPRPIRLAMRLARVDDVLRLTAAPAGRR